MGGFRGEMQLNYFIFGCKVLRAVGAEVEHPGEDQLQGGHRPSFSWRWAMPTLRHSPEDREGDLGVG